MGKKNKKYNAREAKPNGTISYTSEDDEIWSFLVNRQLQVIQGRACDEYLRGLELIDFDRDRIPQPAIIDHALGEATGFGVHPVPAVIPASDFFTLLANRRFPAASFIRSREEIDYLQEPDIFHEYFGHCPLLTNAAYADFVSQYGKLSLDANKQQRKYLFRLFWFTVEFGLIRTAEGLRIFGGGILSSKEETISSLASDSVERLDFTVERALRTPFRIDIVQPLYFVIQSFDELYDILDRRTIYDKIQDAVERGDIPPDHVPMKEGKVVKYNN